MHSTDPKSKRAPRWLLNREGITQHQWRVKKRAELKALEKAFSAYRMGCAYCPTFNGEVGAIQDAINAMKASHAPRVWGR